MVGIDGSTNTDNHNNNNIDRMLTGYGYTAALDGVGYPPFNWQGWIGMVERRHDHDLPGSRHRHGTAEGNVVPRKCVSPEGFGDSRGPKGKKCERTQHCAMFRCSGSGSEEVVFQKQAEYTYTSGYTD